MSLFEHHPAALSLIEDSAHRAGRAANQAAALAAEVDSQSRIASSAVSGTLAVPMARAPVPVVRGSTKASQTALVAQASLNRWGAAVSAYNTAIDVLNARYEAAVAGGFGLDTANIADQPQTAAEYDQRVDAAAASLRSSLRREKAELDRQLDDEADQIAQLLDDGPSDQVVARLVRSGDLSTGFWEEVWERFKKGMKGQVVPPGTENPLDLGRWLTVRALLAAWSFGDWITLYHSGQFLPKGVKPENTLSLPDLKRGWLAAFESNWRVHPDHEASHSRWTTISKWAKWAVISIGAANGAVEQWRRDVDRLYMSAAKKTARAAAAGAAIGSAAWAGGKAGGKAGLSIGMAAGSRVGGSRGKVVASGLGIVLGAIMGGTVGAVAGNSVVAEVAARGDEVEDFINGLLDSLDEFLAPVDERIANVAESANDNLNDLYRWIEKSTGWNPEVQRNDNLNDLYRWVDKYTGPVEDAVADFFASPLAPQPALELVLPLPSAPEPPHPLPVEVVSDDSLWRLADRQLAPDATDKDIQEAAAALYEANRTVIGPDPDLIQPGTRLTVPEGQGT